MNISVFGLGYVGSVTAACMASDGHTVIGVDPIPTKVDLINSGHTPVLEKDLDKLIGEAVAADRLRATLEPETPVLESDLSLVCVGTPSADNGDLDGRHVEHVCSEIGGALKKKENARHVVVVRSTMLPGTTHELVIPTLERSSGLQAGRGFGVCVNPEFLREGSAISDYFNPTRTVVGATDEESGHLLARLYQELPGLFIRTDIRVAETVKYVDNVWHALKVAFGNEVGSVCKASGVDGHLVMDIFVKDPRLNISAAYLRPGFAFGGSCLPKDVRAFRHRARKLDLNLPILEAILPSNRRHIDHAVDMVLSKSHRQVGVLGLSFKPGTDDLRESPLVELVERLLGKGLEIKIFDPNVNLDSLTGTNRHYVLNHLPHISQLLASTAEEVIEHANVVVIGHRDQSFAEALNQSRHCPQVVDLARLPKYDGGDAEYDGICW